MVSNPLNRLYLWSAFSLLALSVGAADLPGGFVYLESVDPSITQEIRYYSSDNFTGQRVEGYENPVCILTAAAAVALGQVQDELRPFGLGLKIFDAYRPQRAVDDFVAWSGDQSRQEMKSRYYPDIRKEDLLRDGYIAARSGHTRGSTVDVTLVSLHGARDQLDMGTPWDFFSPKSWPTSAVVAPGQRAHRLLLQTLMTKHGFVPLQEEWWHFTLKAEPFPDTYFDFPVR
jgi:D-alanyl-D-alanine dipeptidase